MSNESFFETDLIVKIPLSENCPKKTNGINTKNFEIGLDSQLQTYQILCFSYFVTTVAR